MRFLIGVMDAPDARLRVSVDVIKTLTAIRARKLTQVQRQVIGDRVLQILSDDTPGRATEVFQSYALIVARQAPDKKMLPVVRALAQDSREDVRLFAGNTLRVLERLP